MLSNKQTDKILVRNFIDGDYNSFEILFNRHKDRLFSFIMSKVKDRDLADDIFQDTFIKVINSLKQEKYNEEGKFLPWMMRIAYNLVIDHFRQKSKIRKVPQTSDFDIFQILDDGEMNQEEHMIRNESFSDLKILIDQLPEDQKEVLKLRYFKELSYEEIAETLNAPIGTVKAQLYRSREQLFKILSGSRDVF